MSVLHSLVGTVGTARPLNVAFCGKGGVLIVLSGGLALHIALYNLPRTEMKGVTWQLGLKRTRGLSSKVAAQNSLTEASRSNGFGLVKQGY